MAASKKASALVLAEKRVGIGGKFLDEVEISLGASMRLLFPVERHRGSLGEGGTATVYTMMPTALSLFAEGRVSRVGGDPVDLVISGRELRQMVLTEVQCADTNGLHEIAVLVFQPVKAEPST